MQFGRSDPDIWLMGVAPGSDVVELDWINRVRTGWRIKQDTELAPGA